MKSRTITITEEARRELQQRVEELIGEINDG
jgi:predicted CopG family antitoxin